MILFIILSVSLLLVDLATKILTAGASPSELIKGVISVYPTRNTGAAFGMMSGGGIWLILLTLALVAAAGAFYVLHKNKTKFFNTAAAFFFAGAIGNIIDRIFLGYVRDFIKFDIIDSFIGLFSPGYAFAICNAADVFLNVALVMLVIYFLFLDRRRQAHKKDKTAAQEVTADAA